VPVRFVPCHAFVLCHANGGRAGLRTAFRSAESNRRVGSASGRIWGSGLGAFTVARRLDARHA